MYRLLLILTLCFLFSACSEAPEISGIDKKETASSVVVSPSAKPQSENGTTEVEVDTCSELSRRLVLTPEYCPRPELPNVCPLCGGELSIRVNKQIEGGMEKKPCIHEMYGEDFVFPKYSIQQSYCTKCEEWQSDIWVEDTLEQRIECNGYQ